MTIGWDLSSDGHLRQVYQPLGTYASRIEAETALNNYLQEVIHDADVEDAAKGRIKSLFNMMYKYALIHEICDKDYAALFAHKAGKRNKENRHPFKNSEIARL